ncbi:hypothetical protein PQS31_06080 [Luteimonas sp BLCC-B24]|uniref:hypothetical protein n=1 Tax=Luteimonas sp. BLCC-B24 TaxID=3025317 RepID=UPI00234D27E2|nr:hypothetical protein [Luteimonas sp. BLCC-B24]MDC7806391.1 hypothetical protein [Luteimonas sp. BLCC-B24]
MSGKTGSNGRCERIYTFLRANPRPHTIQAIADATDAQHDARITGITLASMVKRGYAERAGGGRKDARYRVGEVMPKAMRARTAGPRPSATAAPRATSSSTSVSPTNRDRSAQIAADIAAFQARGGRIERLGPTLLFRTPRDASNDD